MVVVALLGAVIGLLLGLLGGGGSILAVPALVYGAGLPLAAAVPTSLLVVGLSSATAVLTRLRRVQWRLGGVLGAAGALATVAGTAVNRLLPDRWVLLGFALVMVVAGVRMLHPGRQDADLPPGGSADWRRRLPRAIGAGLGVGFLTGLFGVGGGFLVLPALTLLLGLPMTTAVPTSLAVVALNSAVGFAAHARGGSGIDWPTAAAFAAAAMTGSLAAARLSGRLPAAHLRRGFAVLVLVVAVVVVVEALGG
ncbi:sulfite exporter TauE/SafE family protein [Kineococcus siccus]|uniref:sulfite exporter TauE/SafE family protein n=1 Tax=Kineococcus siccus TaxID=2696567 RepID=UPI00196A65D7|nr:sulfite exporter TauE/SafE family protein [Kineococcus siccus]